MKINKLGYWENYGKHDHVFCNELSDWVCDFLTPHKNKNIIDMGCGLGNYLKELQNKGFKNLLGLEGSQSRDWVFNNIKIQDLTKDFYLGDESKGIVLSFEVGEHIPKEYESVFIENITKHCDSYLIISWAILNQPGNGHVNCMDNDDVIQKITDKGFIYKKELSDDVRSRIKEHAHWFKNTLMVFEKVS